MGAAIVKYIQYTTMGAGRKCDFVCRFLTTLNLSLKNCVVKKSLGCYNKNMDMHINIDEGQPKKKYGKNYMNSCVVPKWLHVLGNMLFFVFMVLAVTTAVLACIYIRTSVNGPSMQPAINASWSEENNLEDTVLINRVQKGERGDIIVVDRTDETEDRYVIKRLVATGGDYVSIVPIKNSSGGETGSFHIQLIRKGETTPVIVDDGITNMVKTYEKFNALKENKTLSFKNIDGVDYLFVEEGKIFYLGDNRNISRDCSSYGPVDANKVVGKVVLIIENGKSVFKECFNYFAGKVFGG